MRLPQGVIYVEGAELQRFLKATGNSPDGSEKTRLSAPVNLAWVSQ